MPARANLSNESITAALAKVGGSVSLAARNLGVSTRTLQRRLKEMSELRPYPCNPLWEQAFDNRIAIERFAEANIYNPNATPLSRLRRHVKWDAEKLLEALPRQLDEQEVKELINDLRNSSIVCIEFDRYGKRAFRPHRIDRTL